MLLPAMHNKQKNKKGLSIVIGYVLLMAVSISMSILVYQFLKTYIPKDSPTCPEGTSILIKEAPCVSNTLTLTLKNNGRFSLDGYFIHGSASADALATIDISQYFQDNELTHNTKITPTGGGVSFNNALPNSLFPEASKDEQIFNFPPEITIKKIEIIPIRSQVIDNFKTIVSCSDAKVETAVPC